LNEVRVCLTRVGEDLSCSTTDVGDTWWEFNPAGDYEATIDLNTIPTELQLNSIRCVEDRHTNEDWGGCQYDIDNRTARFQVAPGTSLDVFFALTFWDGQINHADVSMLAFIDYDQNGEYSSGDEVLSDVQACLGTSGQNPSCLGTEYGTAWWNALYPGDYTATIGLSSVPPGLQLQTIRCEELGNNSKYYWFSGCDNDITNGSTRFELTPLTEIKIYFALLPAP